MPQLELWEAVALSLDIDPRQAKYAYSWKAEGMISSEGVKFNDRLEVCVANVRGKKLAIVGTDAEVSKCLVALPAFAAFAQKLAWTIPHPMTELASDDLVAVPPSTSSKWPWGEHTTELLETLAAAAERFWTLYDPAEPSTAPTNEQVVAWLVTQNVAERVAQIMAQILRADGLRPGPRK